LSEQKPDRENQLVPTIRSLPTDIPIVFDVRIDVRVLAFTAAISALSVIAFGLVPALAASRPDLVPALKGAEVTSSNQRRRITLANTLVVAQVAISLVLLVAAGLFWRSIAGVRATNPGIAVADRTVVSFNPSLLRYDSVRTAAFYRTLLDRASRVDPLVALRQE